MNNNYSIYAFCALVCIAGVMNPTHLRTFLAVRHHLSYTRAAEAVFLSQPAVSRQIQQLERDLGVSLFEQLGRTLHLTDAGRALAQEAESVLARLERVSESIAAYRTLDAGRLRLGAGTTPGFYLLPGILGRFHRKYPNVQIDYLVDNSRAVEQRVLRNEIDLGFIGGAPHSRDVMADAVAEDEIICFAGPKHELAGRKRISVQMLARHTWIVRRQGSATRDLFESWLTQRGGVVGRTIELGCPEAVRAVVAGGIGFSYMSRLAVTSELKSNKLKRLAVTGLRLGRLIYVIRHRDKYMSPAMQAFHGMVGDAFTSRRAGASGD